MIRLTRRHFLASAAALTALPRGVDAEAFETDVIAEQAEAQLVPPQYSSTRVWAYDGVVPGQGLRVPQGARIRRTLINRLPDATTIHWHGIRIDNAMDGVAHLTQEAVPPGGTFLYDFVVRDAGTYWYHPHHNSLEQLARGLSAPLIVEEADAPDVDADIALMINDWRLDAEAQIIDDFDNMHDRSHAGRLGNYLTVNGVSEHTHPAKHNDRLRIRIINAATGRILRIGAQGLEGHVAALDGMPLEAPEPLDSLLIAPAQRADLILDVTAGAGETAFLLSQERDGAYALASFPVSEGGTATRRPPATPLPPNVLPHPALSGAVRAEIVMEGGAMGGMMQAMTADGRPMDMRGLVREGLVWALNGVAGMPEAPLIEVGLRETVRIPIVNRTAFPHAMHLHGHHFRELTPQGLGPARDTLLVAPRSETEIAFVADNPGDWMFHCHMLAHQAAGMMTWLRVV